MKPNSTPAMLVAFIAATRSVSEALRVVGHIGAASGTTIVELHPVIIAIVSACSGVMLAGVTVFSHVRRGRYDPRKVRDIESAMPTATPDDCGNSMYFSVGPAVTNSEAKAKEEREIRAASEQSKHRSFEIESKLLAKSYSQFSIVEMTFETEEPPQCKTTAPRKLEKHGSGLEAAAGCIVDVSETCESKSAASVAFSAVSSPQTPIVGTPMGSSTATSMFYGRDIPSPPRQNPIIIIKGGQYRVKPKEVPEMPIKEVKKVTPCEIMATKSSSNTSKCTIVSLVDSKNSISKVMGSQLVELSLDDSAPNVPSTGWLPNMFNPWGTSVDGLDTRRYCPQR